jgi:hypothetical protein
MFTSTRQLTMFAAALAIAAVPFLGLILTPPPQTSAVPRDGVLVFEMMRNAPLGLSQLDADAI